jgi:hypothetical protein
MPIASIYSNVFHWNLFYIFLSFNLFYMYFGTLKEFLEFYIEKTIGNQKMENLGIVPGRFSAQGLTARSAQWQPSPWHQCHALGAVTTRHTRLPPTVMCSRWAWGGLGVARAKWRRAALTRLAGPHRGGGGGSGRRYSIDGGGGHWSAEVREVSCCHSASI